MSTPMIHEKENALTGIFKEEEGFIILLCDQLPLAGFGETRAAALAMFTKALESYIAHLQHSGQSPRLSFESGGRFRLEGIPVG